ncbi:hypothetical protein FRC02_011725 [Tulasnella sp. 418]|nr:hypothetical protein FRC02_011725 [Tulasnella sp. 418]
MAYDSGIEKHTSKLLEEASKSISRFVRGEIEELETRNYHLSRSNDDLRKELYQYNIRINNLTAQLGFGSLAEAEESLTEDPPLNAENSSRVNVDLYNKYMAIAEQRVTLQEEVSRLSSENEKLKGDINLLRHEVGEGLKSSETHAKALQLIESLTSKNAELEGRLEKELQIYEKNSKRKEAAMVALQDRVRHLEEQSSAHRTATSNVDQMVPTHDKENGISVPLHDATNSPASRNSILPSDKPYHDASYEGLKTIHRLLMEKYDALRGEYTKRNNEFEDAKTTWERRFHELANKVIESSKRALKKMHGEKVAGTIGDDHGAAGMIMEKFMESWHESFSDLISSTPDKDKDAPDKPKHSNLATCGPSEIEAEGVFWQGYHGWRRPLSKELAAKSRSINTINSSPNHSRSTSIAHRIRLSAFTTFGCKNPSITRF